MYEPLKFIDLHMHSESRSTEDFSRLQLAGCRGVMAVAGPGGGYSSAQGLEDHFRRLHVLERKRLRGTGIHPWIAIGAHPAALPENGLETFLENWPKLAEKYEASAVGEVGLWKMDEPEQRVLARAFEVAKQMNLPVVMHTPVDAKLRALDISLDLLAKSGLEARMVVADHLTQDTLPLAKSAGCNLGLSIHPVKLSPFEAAKLVDEFGPEGVMLNSDLGASPSYLFAIPGGVSAMRDMGLDERVISKVVFDNAAQLMGMDF